MRGEARTYGKYEQRTRTAKKRGKQKCHQSQSELTAALSSISKKPTAQPKLDHATINVDLLLGNAGHKPTYTLVRT